MGPSDLNAGDRRKHTRKPCLVKVILRTDGETWSGTILNYSEGGAYIATNRAIDTETKLRLRFRRPVSGRVADMEGIVRRIVALGDAVEPEPGISIQFVELLSTAPDALGASGVFPASAEEEIGFKPEPSTPPVVDRISSTRITVTETSADADSPEPSSGSAASHSWSRHGSPDSGRSLQARKNRSVAEIDVTFTPHTGSSPPLPAKVINLSKGGMYLAMRVLPTLDSVLTVSFTGEDVDDKDTTLDVVVQAAWSSTSRPHVALPRGIGCRIVGFHSNTGRRRYERLLRALLVIGNPIFKTI